MNARIDRFELGRGVQDHDNAPSEIGGPIRKASAPEEFPWTLEIALSGGGLRASAFGLGALLYLVDAGLNTKVQNIVSVSGGSITNGFVGCRCDYRTVDSDTFKGIAAELARRIAFNGIWSSRHVWLYVSMLLFATTCALSLLLMPMLATLPRLWLWTAIALIIGLLYCRGWPITCWLVATFFPDQNSLGDLSGRSVEHVFCATDLNYSIPFFFATSGGGRAVSERHGRATAHDVPVHIAARASAAFPPFIPPIWFRTSAGWHYIVGGIFGKNAKPARVWLSDGGAFNNLGTDWSLLRQRIKSSEIAYIVGTHAGIRGDISKHPAINDINKNASAFVSAQVQLAVDASQPAPEKRLLRLHVPILAFFAYVGRTIDVLYGSTLRARTEGAVDIAHQRILNEPDRWGLKGSQNILNTPSLPEDRMGALRIFISRMLMPLEFINERYDLNAHRIPLYSAQIKEAQRHYGYLWPNPDPVKTTFNSLGNAHTLRLIVHGYLMTREALTAVFPIYWPPPIPNVTWFEELLFDEQTRKVRTTARL